MDNQLDHILLEPEQKELLLLVVEAARNTPRENRQEFHVIRIDGGVDLLSHPGISGSDNRIYYGDVEILGQHELVNLRLSINGTSNFDVTPLGFRYYEHLKKKMGEPIQRIVTSIREYLDSPGFRDKYPEAYNKWSSAEDLLWQTDSQQQLTAIGHHCREALQEFANALVKRYNPPDVNSEKNKTILRLNAVLQVVQLSKKKKDLLTALQAYWATTDGLVQRQEHGAGKEGEQLVWEDARRIVFHTMLTMYEIDKTL